MENLQHEHDTWNEERLERIDYINQELKKRGHAVKTFKDVDQAMQEYIGQLVRVYHSCLLNLSLRTF